jgi:putative tryptophan/tyrosine transport system permease protein
MTIELILSGVLQGLILAIIAYGIMIPFRILNFPDLTAEGAYPLGGAVCATLITIGMPLIVSIFVSMLIAGMLSIATCQVYLKLKVNSLLAGIILSTMAYSINLRIMGKPNIALFEHGSLFSHDIIANITIIFLILSIFVAAFLTFLHSDYGLRFRAVGLNTSFVKKQGISIEKYSMLGMFISGSLFGLAGSFMVQIQSYMDVGMGIGIVIHALASLMVGEIIIGNYTIRRQMIAPLIGALIYQQIQGLAISLGLAPSDLKFFTGFIVLLVIFLQKRAFDIV